MYSELHCRTNFSFLEGASHPDELVNRATELGYHALAITDRESLAGVVRAHVAAKATGLKLLIGAEITPCDAPPVILLAIDRAGYGRLSRLLTIGRRRAVKGACELQFADIAEHHAGLLAVVKVESGKRKSGVKKPQIPDRKSQIANLDPFLYREVFGDRCYWLAELHCGPNDALRLRRWVELSRAADVPSGSG